MILVISSQFGNYFLRPNITTLNIHLATFVQAEYVVFKKLLSIND